MTTTARLRCPVDQKVMAVHRDGSVEVQVCRDCSGVWLTREQLASNCVRRETLPSDSRRPRPLHDRPLPSARQCSQCAVVLEAQTVEGVEIDLCPKCGGLWLDAGEFDAVHSWYIAHNSHRPEPRSSSTTSGLRALDPGAGAGDAVVAAADGFGEILEFVCSSVGAALEGL